LATVRGQCGIQSSEFSFWNSDFNITPESKNKKKCHKNTKTPKPTKER
jgi:hypothetical protein